MQDTNAEKKVRSVTFSGFLQLAIVFTILILSQISLVFAPSNGVEIVRKPGVTDAAERDAAIAVEAVKTFFMDNYNVQLKRDIRIVLTPNQDVYIQAQIEQYNVSEEEAKRRARNTSASSQGTIILQNLGHPALTSTPARVANISHEMIHQYQDELTNGKPVACKWLTEGMAGILAVALTENWGGKSLTSYQKYCLNEINASSALPKLTELRTSKQWRDAQEKYGASIIYRLSETAVLELHSAKGWDAFVTYYKNIDQTADKHMHFEHSFGIALDAFEEQITANFAKGK